METPTGGTVKTTQPMATLNEIQASLSTPLRQLNDIIADMLHSESALTNEIVESYLRVKGKQLRPMLALLSGQFFGEITEQVLYGAAAIELLHNASLIHDDVIDQARERRGRATINSVWDNHVAVLIGDFFVTAALRCAVKANDPRVLEMLANMGRNLSLGEINQVDVARNHNINEATYMQIISAKTASLFESCIAIGGYAVGADEKSLSHLRRYAGLLGICFQIKDDIFDYFDDPIVGKPTGNDLREGKVTLPLIHTLSRTDLPEHDEMTALVHKDQLSEQEINKLVEWAKLNGGIDYAYATMERLRQEADHLLDHYPDNPTTPTFKQIFSFIIKRNK